MEKTEVNVVPALYTRGSHYQVGYNIGKTFGSLIKDFLDDLKSYKEISLPLYDLPEGRKEYDRVLDICNAQFPHYVEEIKGMADGAGLPFHKLFILHVEYLMTATESSISPKTDHGCTDIMCNNTDEVILGHTEDAYPECLGRTYIVQAEIIDDVDGQVKEQFSSISYPGFLPGYTMGFNNHGMIHSINTVNPEKRNPNGTPREFIARALLAVKSLDEALEVLKNPGHGIADGFNVNIHFAKQDGGPIVYSIEVGPSMDDGKKESSLDVLQVPVGDSYYHCNRYVRLNVGNAKTFFAVSTDYRIERLKGLPKARNENDIKKYLSDKQNVEWPIFRNGKGEDKGQTVLTGLFNTSNKTWTLFTGPAASTNPVAVIHMNF